MSAAPAQSVVFIYRAMEEENGFPRLGTTATRLGIRIGVDIVPDAQGLVHMPLFIPGEPNGLSCAPSVAELPPFALPVAWGGRNKKTLVWRLNTGTLGADLVAQEDTEPGKARHFSVGPSRSMPFGEYVQAIEGTRPWWEKV